MSLTGQLINNGLVVAADCRTLVELLLQWKSCGFCGDLLIKGGPSGDRQLDIQVTLRWQILLQAFPELSGDASSSQAVDLEKDEKNQLC